MNAVKAIQIAALFCFLIFVSGCDRRPSDGDQKIANAVAEATCDAARNHVLMLLKVAGAKENIDSTATLAEEGQLANLHVTRLEGQVARMLSKYHETWQKKPKSQYLNDVGVSVADYSEQDELAWKIGKEICIKLASQ